VDEPQSGSRIAGFTLRHRLGAGGMGEVWAATRGDENGRLVALKLVRSGAVPGRNTSMFLDEARTATALRHPGIVSTFESGVERGFMYIVMELIRGPSLYRLVRRVRRAQTTFPFEAVARIGVTVADALEYAHHVTVRGRALGLVHRDVSPHNVLLDLEGRPFLSDFGVARSSFQEHETAKGEIRGKPGYMSPEQVNEEPIDHRSDLFALGIVLWEVTTLKRLFKRESLMQSLVAVAHDVAPDVRELRPDAPPRLAEVIGRCLAKAPNDRHQSAAEVRDALAPVAKSGSRSAERLRELVQACFRNEEFELGSGAAPASHGPTSAWGNAEGTASSTASGLRARPARESRRAPAEPSAEPPGGADASPRPGTDSGLRPRPGSKRRLPAVAAGVVGVALGVGLYGLGAPGRRAPTVSALAPGRVGAPRDPVGPTGRPAAAPKTDALADPTSTAETAPTPTAEDAARRRATDELVRAAHRGDRTGVTAALEAGAELDGLGDGGWTALHAAAHRGHRAIARVLVDAGANPDARTEDTGATPLILAARYGDAELAVLLLRADADVEASDDAGDRALHAAVTDPTETSGPVVRRLVAAGAELEARGHLDHTPLVRAAVQGDLDGLQTLLELGAAPDAPAAGAPALWHAAAAGRDDIVRALLDRGARRDVTGPDGRDAADAAEAAGHAGTARLLRGG
jgi:serine/threonine-protein kinase